MIVVEEERKGFRTGLGPAPTWGSARWGKPPQLLSRETGSRRTLRLRAEPHRGQVARQVFSLPTVADVASPPGCLGDSWPQVCLTQVCWAAGVLCLLLQVLEFPKVGGSCQDS